jgi:RNA polymerase subunit RPABC4/transcription elongation factor Spt4
MPKSSEISNSIEGGVPNAVSAPDLICKRCGAIVPPGKLICDCFSVDAENESWRRRLEGFVLRTGTLWMVKTSAAQSQRHLIAADKNAISLCGAKRYKRKPETREVNSSDSLLALQVCSQCLYLLDKARKEILGK